ncbi:MAG TPA: hypothetical protein VFR78_09180 [Pyrinomonadaceae bacterium]|nr:hypothetical protein [Pyrinomonadaceae bacterium]
MTRELSEIEPITRQEAELAFASGTSREVCMALLRLVYHDDDWQWIQDKCIELSKSPDVDVAGLAITCLGHLARIHRTLALDKVLPVLNERRANSDLAGRVDDALDDMEMYMDVEIDRSTNTLRRLP